MDKLVIKDLEVFGYRGVHPHEDKEGEKFVISAELLLDLKLAGITDRISNTINSVSLCRKLEEQFSNNTHKLMERSAEELATYILLNYGMVRHVSLTLKKPWAPVGRNVEYVGVEIEREWRDAYIGLGSNIEDRLGYISSALEAIDNSDLTRVVDLSPVYETAPVGVTDQPSFLNAVVKVQTLLPPRSLITILLSFEKSLKRVRKKRWGPRTIDLDILFFDGLITSFEEVVVPHPRLHKRMFVVKPLSDVAPYFLHPVLNERVIQTLEKLKEKGEVEPPVYDEDVLGGYRRTFQEVSSE